MTHGVNRHAPALSEDGACNVAAFVHAQPRPHKANLDRDYRVALQRPADRRYGSYVGELSAVAKGATVGPAR